MTGQRKLTHGPIEAVQDAETGDVAVRNAHGTADVTLVATDDEWQAFVAEVAGLFLPAEGEPLRLRVGRELGTTLYEVHPDGTEEWIGGVKCYAGETRSRQVAAQIVEAVNARADAG